MNGSRVETCGPSAQLASSMWTGMLLEQNLILHAARASSHIAQRAQHKRLEMVLRFTQGGVAQKRLV